MSNLDHTLIRGRQLTCSVLMRHVQSLHTGYIHSHSAFLIVMKLESKAVIRHKAFHLYNRSYRLTIIEWLRNA